MPLQAFHKGEVPVHSGIHPSKMKAQTAWQYWFDPYMLFKDMLSSHVATDNMHFGMAEYSNGVKNSGDELAQSRFYNVDSSILNVDLTGSGGQNHSSTRSYKM